MRLLVHAGMLGSILWMLVLLISYPYPLAGQGTTSLLLSILWHPLVAAGWLGIHHCQSRKWNSISFTGALIIAFSFLVFIPIPLSLLTYGYAELPLARDPESFKWLQDTLVFPGYLLLSISILKNGYFPAVTAYVLMLAYLGGLFLDLQHPYTAIAALGECALPLMLLFFGWYGLRWKDVGTGMSLPPESKTIR